METFITEIFYSLSGEGISQGTPTVFVRFSGCSLRCGKTGDRKLWCDTKYSLSPKVGEKKRVPEVLERINSLSPNPTQVILTGGEPLEGESRMFCVELVSEFLKKDLMGSLIKCE